MKTPEPLESLSILSAILQRMSLPMVADNGQLSHTVVAMHVENIKKHLSQDEETQE